MKEEKSCGAVLFTKDLKVILINLVNGGHWSFPKGHVEGNEDEKETALREIKEETGLKVKLIDGFRTSTRYSPKEGVIKEVVYFISIVENSKVSIQKEEVNEYTICSIEEALKKVTYENDRKILIEATNFIKDIKN